MEKKIKKALILIAVLLLLTSCKSNSRAAEVKPEPPLRFYEKCGTDKGMILYSGDHRCKTMALYTDKQLENMGINPKEFHKSKKQVQVDELYLVKTRIQNDLKLPDNKITIDEVLDWMKFQMISFEFRVDGNLATVYNSKYVLFTWDMKKSYLDDQKREVVEYLVKRIYNYDQLPGVPKYQTK